MVAERVAWTPAVTDALAGGRAVVVLESTVIAQGLPWPENLETARAAESAVRQAGAEPATVAVLGGSVRIGLTDPELVEVARSAATETEIEAVSARDATTADDAIARSRADLAGVRAAWAKANRRDLAPIVAAGRNAATTVSATLWIARRFALEPRVMATGGLGGVHRDAAISFDLSTDLDELARADGALVVCSGMKSILDLSATLESLETRGVLVVGYRTDELPGFLVRSSGLPLEHRVDSPAEAAELVRVHRSLGLPGAIVLTQPVPEVRRPGSRLAPGRPRRRAGQRAVSEHRRQAADAVLARRDPPRHGRAQPPGQLRPPGGQRAPGRRSRRGARLALRPGRVNHGRGPEDRSRTVRRRADACGGRHRSRGTGGAGRRREAAGRAGAGAAAGASGRRSKLLITSSACLRKHDDRRSGSSWPSTTRLPLRSSSDEIIVEIDPLAPSSRRLPMPADCGGFGWYARALGGARSPLEEADHVRVFGKISRESVQLRM